MRQTARIAYDLLLEAARRKWFLGLFGAITVILVLLGLTLELDVVDGAIAGSKLFGQSLLRDIIPGDTALGFLYFAVANVSFYGGALFLAVACGDFATELLAPGRIEHLLSLPVSRAQLLFGTWLGVLTLAAAGTVYGSLGLSLLLGFKSGLWSFRLVEGAFIGWVGFCAIYSAMITVVFFVRSAALSSAAGVATLIVGIFSSNRETVVAAIDSNVGRWCFRALVMPFPRLSDLGLASASVAMGRAVDWHVTGRLLVACFVFSAGLLSLAVWRFERKDY